MIDIPVPLKALQIARHMMGFDPLWTEGIMLVQHQVAALLDEHTDYYGAWIPIRIINHPGFIRIEENGLAGEYRAVCDPLKDRVLDIDPISIQPNAPITLQHRLQEQLDVWPEEANHLSLKAMIAQLANPAFVPYLPKIRNALQLSFETNSTMSSPVSRFSPYIHALLAEASEAFSQLRLCGREMAVVLAFTTLSNIMLEVLEKAEMQHEPYDQDWIIKNQYIFHRAFFSAALSCSENILNSFLNGLVSAGHIDLIVTCAEQFEAYTNDAFEKAKAAGVSAEMFDEAAEHVCHDFGYALTVWSDMHHLLKMMLPAAYAGQMVARFLRDHTNLNAEKAEKIRFIYKQCDETVVIIMTSLSHAVRMHDPLIRASHVALIREAREKNGEVQARAVIRNLVEQQAFYPSVWKKWLDQASRAH